MDFKNYDTKMSTTVSHHIFKIDIIIYTPNSLG